MAPPSLSRRRLLATSAGIPGALFVVALGCQEKEFSCAHTTGVPPEGIAIRQNLAYQDRSPKPELTCDTCNHFVPASSSGACGTCKVMPGPTHALGTCKVWVKKG